MFVRSKAEAITIANKCLDKIQSPQTSEGWEISKESIQNTMDYLFDKLSHQCYMVCIANGEKEMHKLIPGKTSPEMQKVLSDSLRNNRTLTPEQRAYVSTFLKKPFRIMQCILKPYTDAVTIDNNEYFQLIQDIDLPDGVFIFNLTDAVILREDRRHPFQYAVHSSSKVDGPFLPIFSISGAKGYSDIVIPNYDDVFIALGKELPPFTTEWDKKTINKAVFRGGPSGCGYTTDTNQRLKLASMKSDLLDAQITGKNKTIDSKSVKFDPKYGLGMMNTGQKPGEFMSMENQSEYKYIVHVDGNVNAYRLLTTMASGSLILRVESEYTSWAEDLIQANKHYIPIKSDLSDLEEKIRWCMKNNAKCKTIAQRGAKFAREALTPGFIRSFLQKTMQKIVSSPKKEKVKRKIAEKVLEPQPKEPTQNPEKALEKEPKKRGKKALEPEPVEPEKEPQPQQTEKKTTKPKTAAQYMKLAEQRKKCIQTYRNKFYKTVDKKRVTRKNQKIEETI